MILGALGHPLLLPLAAHPEEEHPLKKPRRLALKREALIELTTHDLRAVVGGNAIITEGGIDCLTPIIDPPDNTHVCSDSCFL